MSYVKQNLYITAVQRLFLGTPAINVRSAAMADLQICCATTDFAIADKTCVAYALNLRFWSHR